jgi:hypothetical protein
MEWKLVRSHVLTCAVGVLFSIGSVNSFAVEPSCSIALLKHVKDIANLVRTSPGAVEAAKQAALAEFSEVTPADLDQAIQHEVQELEKLARGVSDGPAPADIEKAKAALSFARHHGLKIEAAMMKAIKEANADVVEGFLVMILHGNGICDATGYNRFCKKIDFAAGWNGENFLVEAGKTSLRAARALIRGGAEAPLELLVVTKFGAEASAAAIEQGTRASFQELIPIDNETAAVKLIVLGAPFTIADLKLAVEHNKKDIFEAALKLHPQLANAHDGQGVYPLFYTVEFNRPQMAFTLIKTYDVNVNQRLKKEQNETALMHASRLGRTQIISMLVEAKADPNLSTEQGGTALLQPAKGSSVSLLLDAGADPLLGLADGWLPIHRAVYYTLFEDEFMSHVRELVLAGADVNAVASRTVDLDYSKLYANGPTAQVGPTVTPLAMVTEFLKSSKLSDLAYVTVLRDYLVENGAK